MHRGFDLRRNTNDCLPPSPLLSLPHRMVFTLSKHCLRPWPRGQNCCVSAVWSVRTCSFVRLPFRFAVQDLSSPGILSGSSSKMRAQSGLRWGLHGVTSRRKGLTTSQVLGCTVARDILLCLGGPAFSTTCRTNSARRGYSRR